MITNININSDWYDSFEICTYTNLNNNNNSGKDIFLRSKKENICIDTKILVLMLIKDLKYIFQTNNKNITDSLIKNKISLIILVVTQFFSKRK